MKRLNKKIIIMRANKEDCKTISKLINDEALNNTVLKKEPEKIMEFIDNYFVAVDDNKIIGTVGFKVWPGRQPEIISLVVKENYRGMGVARLLVDFCLETIKERGFRSVFCLTAIPDFFENFGFSREDIRNFSDKIWKDCQFCPKNAGGPTDPRCNEVAMRLIM